MVEEQEIDPFRSTIADALRQNSERTKAEWFVLDGRVSFDSNKRLLPDFISKLFSQPFTDQALTEVLKSQSQGLQSFTDRSLF